MHESVREIPQGHEVGDSMDGVEGIGGALSTKPEVVIIDIGLPELDGYQVARQIRASKPGDGMTLIALSGYGQPEDKRRAQQAGFDAHLVKPVTPEALQRVLAGIVKIRPS